MSGPSEHQTENRLSLSPAWWCVPVGLWLVLQIGPVVWSMGPMFFHGFYGPDDYMRMRQVFDFLQAPLSSPFVLPRLGADGVNDLAWTRIEDFVPALIVLMSRPFLGAEMAGYLAGTLTPALYCAVFFVCGYRFARLFLQPQHAVLSLIILALTWPMMRQFMPGRVDHHALVLICHLLAARTLVQALRHPEKWCYPLWGGVLYGMALTIAVEILPWIGFSAGCLALYWVFKGHRYRQLNILFAAGLLGASILGFFMFRFPWAGAAPACDVISPQILMFASVVFLFWAVVSLFRLVWLKGVIQRGAVAFAAGSVALALLYLVSAGCLHDPYQIEDSIVRMIWLNDVQEALPWFRLWSEGYGQLAVQSLLPLLLGGAGAVYLYRSGKAGDELFYIAGMMAAGLCLMNIQIRYAEFSVAVCAPFALIFFMGIKERMSRHVSMTPQRRIACAFLFFCLCAAFLGWRIYDVKVPHEAGDEADGKCASQRIAYILNKYETGTVAAYVNLGPELLWRTKHRVLAAPYHMNEYGIRSVFDVMTAPDAKAALSVMERDRIDFIVLCPSERGHWLERAKYRQDIQSHENIFAVQILQGKIPPELKVISDEWQGKAVILKRHKKIAEHRF